MVALDIYYRSLTLNLIESLGDTFTNPIIDTSLDVSDYLILIEKKYLSFKKVKELSRCNLVKQLRSFNIPNSIE